MEAHTIDLLERAAQKIYSGRVESDPKLRECEVQEETEEKAFFQKHQNNRTLTNEVLKLLDTRDTSRLMQRNIFFRLGLQMGLELGTLNLISSE